MKHSKARSILLAATALTLALSGCAAGGDQPAPDTGGTDEPTELTRITVAEQAKAGLTTGALAHLADQLGYFEDEGLEVEEWISVTNGADAISGILSGEVQFTHIGPEGFIAAAQGGDIVGIAANTDASIWTVVTNPEVNDWQDLKGTTIALGSTGDITRVVFDELAVLAGLDPAQDLEYVALGATPERVTAVQQGHAAGTIAAYPTAGIVIEDGLNNLGFSPEGTEPPQYMTTVIDASRSWAEAHPEQTAGYLRAISRARAFMVDPANSQEAAEIISPISGVPTEFLVQGIDRYFVNPPAEGIFFPADFRHVDGVFEATVEAYRQLGLFSGQITEDEYMDYSYADKALSQ